MAARTTRMSRSRANPLHARTGRVPQAATSDSGGTSDDTPTPPGATAGPAAFNAYTPADYQAVWQAIIDDCQRGRLRRCAAVFADSVKWFVFGGAR